ncbi:transposon Ty3-G Gag-Pol polyprotein [Trichonephila clavipes]|nr:transposon Ty3-G Gag-Pol polyprotein [Trichonephila clavipes]
MVKKKDDSSRMCIDYRKLNQKLVKDKFPLPLIEDVLDTLQEAKVYSTLNLRNGFFHVDVDEDCRIFSSIVRDFLELFYNLWRTVLAKNKIVLDPALRLQSFRTPENATIGVRGGVECQQQERWRPSSRLF